MMLKKIVYPMERLPKRYGVAYCDNFSQFVVCYPVPLNLIIQFIRHVWDWLRAWRPSTIDAAFNNGWKTGHSIRRHYDYQDGYRDGQRELLDNWMTSFSKANNR